jgi:aminopeptidase N
MIKTYLFAFLTIFLLLNTKHATFAQFPLKENRAAAVYSDTLDALHYGVHLTDINLTNKTIKGYTTVTLVSKINSLSSVKLELARLTVDSVFINDIKTNAFNHTANNIHISLTPILLQVNDTVKVGVYYHGQTFVDPSGWGGFHFSGDYALNLGVGFDAIPHNLGKAWFPCIDDFRDRALYDVYLTVTNDKKAISGGNLVGVTDLGNNLSTWHWKTDYSLPTYLISATTGKYELVADSYTGQQRSIPITYYCRSADISKVAGTFVNLKNIMQVFESQFGPYPFERIGYIGTPGNLGAMEHASNISYPFSGWTGNSDNEWWYAHELSHMWFGDMVTCASAEDMWLNEGWAVWCESLYREYIYGKQAYRDNMRSKLKDVLLTSHIVDGGYYAVAGIPQTLTYGNTVYQKGGQVAHTLRGYMGDSLFFGGVKSYLQQYAYNFASSINLRDYLSAYSGLNLNPFFEAWVFSPGFPHYSIDSVVTIPYGNGYNVTVYIHQKLKGVSTYANENRLEIAFLNNNWQKITDTILFSGVTGHKTFFIPYNPVEVMVDPDEKLSDATTDIIKTIKNTGEIDFPQTYSKVITEQISDSALVRITHNWVAADSLQILQPGLRISDSRYWTVEGLFPEGFKAKGKFSYSRSNGLDSKLITNSKDSLFILFRLDSGHPWTVTPFTRVGPWISGTITVDSLKRGEYVLAVWDYKFLGENKSGSGKLMKIYPNPANESVHVELAVNQKTILCIYDSLGKLLSKSYYPAGNNCFSWGKNQNSLSVYHFKLCDLKGNLIGEEKVIFN